MEEYELALSDMQIKALFDCFAEVEELLNITPLDEYSNLGGLSITTCVLALFQALS